MYNSIIKLIWEHYYKAAEVAQYKLDTFYAVDRLTDEEYAELTELVINVYNEE